MDRALDHSGVIRHGANDGMFMQEGQRLLVSVSTPLEQRAQRPQTKAAVRKGRMAGFFQCFGRVAFRQRQEPLQHAHALNAADWRDLGRLGSLGVISRR